MKKVVSIFMVMVLVCIWFPLSYIPQFTEEVETVVSKEYSIKTEEVFHTNMKLNTVQSFKKVEADRMVKLEELKSNIIDEVGEDIGYFSLIYYEFDTEDIIEINSEYLFKPASTYKVPLNMLLYDKAFKGEIDIKSSMMYYNSDYEDGAGILQGSDELYEPIALTTLSEYSIVYSDNIASNMITRNLGYYNVIEYMEQVSGIEIEDVNYIKPKIFLAFLEKLYYNVDNNPYYDTLIEYMKNTIFHERIDAFIPHEIVAHKIGDFEQYVNDIGIVYTQRPYIVIFYTEGFSYEAIAEISKMIYDYNIQN